MKQDPNDLMERILVFVQKYGKIEERSSNPMMANLRMSYDKPKGLSVKTSIYIHCMGNGSCKAEVMYNGSVVLEAAGNMMAKPFNVTINKYEPGSWEKKLK